MPLPGFNRYVILGALGTIVFLSGGCQQYVDKPLVPEQSATELLNRSLADPGLREFLKQNTGRDLPASTSTWDFETLNWVAFYYNPSLAVARAQWAGARGSIITGAQRPNPSVNFSPGYDFNPAAGTISPWFLGGSFDLPIETAGKRDKRIQTASWQSEAARQNLFDAAWQVRGELRQALLDWDAAQRRTDILQKQVQANQLVVQLLEERLNAGAISADEISTQRLALVKAQSDAGNATRALALARAKLAEVLGVPVSALDGQAFSTDSIAQGHVFSGDELSAARTVSLKTRADVLASLASYQASQSALQLEIAKQYPDLHVGSGYLYDLGENKWNLSLGIDIPLFNHNQGPIAEAQAARELAAAQFIAVQAHVITQIDSANAVAQAAAGQLEDLRKVDTELHKHLDSMHAQTDAGAADRLDYQTALLDASASELALLDAQSQLASAIGQLEDALQVPFANLPALENDPHAPTPVTKP